jgi:nucleotide-binding universal stress UspA family protein
MYKRILLPTDGSALSRQAVQHGVRFAQECGAEVIGIHVVALAPAQQLEAWAAQAPHLTQRRQAMFDKFAEEYLAFITAQASAAQVPSTVIKVRSPEPWQAITRAALDLDCDLIFLASHGWKGDRALLLGSETVKVLQESKVPVLVHKPPAAAAEPA